MNVWPPSASTSGRKPRPVRTTRTIAPQRQVITHPLSVCQVDRSHLWRCRLPIRTACSRRTDTPSALDHHRAAYTHHRTGHTRARPSFQSARPAATPEQLQQAPTRRANAAPLRTDPQHSTSGDLEDATEQPPRAADQPERHEEAPDHSEDRILEHTQQQTDQRADATRRARRTHHHPTAHN